MTPCDTYRLRVKGVGYGAEACATSSLNTRILCDYTNHAHNLKTSAKNLNLFPTSEIDIKTYVLGGEPPEELRDDAGFSQWAVTVRPA